MLTYIGVRANIHWGGANRVLPEWIRWGGGSSINFPWSIFCGGVVADIFCHLAERARFGGGGG